MGAVVLPVACGPYASGHKTAGDFVRFIRDVRTAVWQIADCRNRFRIDLIYVNGPRLVPAAALSSGRLPMVFHCHSLLAPRYLEWLTAVSLRFARARIVASSYFVAGPLLRHVARKQVTVIYSGVKRLRPRVAAATAFRIGVIGRIAPEKGQDIFLLAARQLHSRVPGCSFVVCGAPLFSDASYEAGIKQLAEGLPVEFTGWLDDVGPVMARLDMLVVPSTPVDATPRVIMQAFSARVPVVAFANEGFRELIDNGKTGFLVETRTAEALSERIEEVLKGGLLDSVADAAYREWKARFSLAAYQANVIRFLERAV
jgi:glycosyltransferase involved in cell wall biosynthesis